MVSKRAAPKPGEVHTLRQTPALWWGLLGAGCVLCIVLLVSLISNLLPSGEGDVGDDFVEQPAIDRSASGEPRDGEPVDPPVEPGPGEQPAVVPEPVVPEPVAPQPVEPQPVAPEPVAPRPVASLPTETPPVRPTVVETPPLPTPPVEPPVTPDPEPTTPLPPPPKDELEIAGLPMARPGPGDARAPRIADGAAGAELDRGVKLLVFAPAPETRAASTIRAAHALHRRLRETGVEVVVVIPRAALADASGVLLSASELTARAVELGAGSDLRIVLDPADGAPHGSALRNRWRVRRDTAAMVLSRGREEFRTMPPEGAFSIQTLADIARRALSLTPSAVPGR
jgi:hypothetical protein